MVLISLFADFPIFKSFVQLFLGKVFRKFPDSFLQVIQTGFGLICSSSPSDLQNPTKNESEDGTGDRHTEHALNSEDRKEVHKSHMVSHTQGVITWFLVVSLGYYYGKDLLAKTTITPRGNEREN